MVLDLLVTDGCEPLYEGGNQTWPPGELSSALNG